ncbi:hypothetical protein G6F32_006578 [Rhizopus arrhizus]|nr:hypothetical protein G6F24_003291 [Rhizopus arrhizus]KAG0946419.1 hypothetical protein G6F32_006578 [Rhizopus arrhizus]
MYNDEGSQYLVRVGIGNPIQNFTVALDTGSSDLWVPSVHCPVHQCPFKRFDPQKSNTFQGNVSQEEFSINYGVGSVRGEYGQDSVYLEGAHVSNQVFGMASFTQDIIHLANTDQKANGIFGLGYPSLSSNAQHLPFIFQLIDRHLIDRPMFAISMGSVDEPGWAGEIVLGGVNKERFQGPIHYVSVGEGGSEANKTYWMVSGQGIQVTGPNGSTIMNSSFERDIILDTGTTLTYMDRALVDNLVGALSPHVKLFFDAASQTYLGDCQAIAQTEHRLQILLERGLVLNVPVRDLLIPLEGDHCLFGIAPWMKTQPSQKMENKGWIMLGDSVLRSIYLVFDMENHQVGFAEVFL